MSGTGKKQRTKGNVKPSSSARAAELLAAEGYSLRNTIGFTGFGAVSLAPESEGPVSGTTEEPDDLDQDFRCSFRKAMKKDAVTKTKALREIAALVTEKDPKAISIAWQCWPRLYAKLALDGNFKVRELSHVTLSAFTQQLGRQIASQLKNVMPFWIIGEHDPYQTVAQASRQAFQDTFPTTGRRPEVLAFCKEAIISQCGTLVFAVEEASAEGQSGSDEESPADRAARLSACSLWALHKLLSTISVEQLKSAEDNFHQALFSHPKFYKLCEKAKPTAVRVAWFNLISAFLRQCHGLLSDKAAKLVPALVNALDDSESAVVGSSWSCVASYVDVDSNVFWHNCNLKAFLPKLISMTSKAYKGCAAAIGPAITKVLRCYPFADDAADVHRKLLSAFHTGCARILDTKTKEQETTAFIRVYCDYCVVMYSGYALAPGFVKECLTNPEQSLFVIAACLKSPFPQQCLNAFDHFAEMVAFVIDKLPNIEPNLGECVAVLQSNLLQTIRCQLEIKPNEPVLSHFLAKLHDGTAKLKDECASIARLCWRLYEEKGDPIYAHIFANLLSSLREIGEFVSSVQEESNVSVAMDGLLTSLINRLALIDADGECSTEPLRDILRCCFTLFPALSSGQKKTLFSKLCELRRFEAQYQFLCQLKNLNIDSVLECIPRDEFSRLFMDSFKSLCSSAPVDQSPSSFQWGVFADYLGDTAAERSVLPKKLPITVLEYLMSLVQADDADRNFPFVLTLVSQLTSEILHSRPDLLTTQPGVSLVVQLFDIACVHSEDLNEETLVSLKKAWSSALETFIRNCKWDKNDDNNLLAALGKRILNHARRAVMNRELLESLSAIALEVILACNTDDEATLLHTALRHVLPFSGSMLDVDCEVTNLWKINAVIIGRFPLLDFTFMASLDDVVNSAKDCIEFLNLSAYILRLGSLLIASSASVPRLTPSQMKEQFAGIAVWGFASLSCIYHTLALLSVTCTPSTDKSFGKWVSSLAKEFWISLQPSDRGIVAESALKMTSRAGALATQAIGFLQYDFRDEGIPVDSARYNDIRHVSTVCAAESLAKTPSVAAFPDTRSISSVSGYVHIAAAGNSQACMDALKWLMSIKSEFLDDKMLFSCVIANVDDDTIVLNIALMRLLGQIIPLLPDASNEQRDFVLCATLTWLQSCAESDLSHDLVQLFSIFAVKLFRNVADFVNSISGDPNADGLTEEWNGFFLKGCNLIVGSIFYKLALTKQQFTSPWQHYLLLEASAAIRFARKEDLEDLELPTLLAPELDSLLYPEKLQTLLLSTFPLLERPCVPVQVAACSVLEQLVEDVYEYESKNVTETDAGETSRELPSYFLTALNNSFERLEAELDNLHHLENNASFCCYLLTWKLLLRFFSAVKSDDRPGFSSALASSKLLDKLMLTLFAVLPEKVFSSGKASSQPDEFERRLSEFGTLFEEAELKSVLDVPDASAVFLEAPVYSNEISATAFLQRYSCHILLETLRTFPAAIRFWFNCQEKKLSNLVERFVVRYVSPLLCASEIQSIAKGEKKYGNMTLVARPAAREIVASYKLEDFTMELVVILPQNYPLSAATVDVSNRVGVSVEQWRKWMLQLTVFLSHQNGNLLDGMLLWKRCIDKHLQGVEDCMICMMAVHGSNYQLPKITCKQCKKKFHAACLYKWFNTSSNTSCPLCRTTF